MLSLQRMDSHLEAVSINTIRMLAVDAVESSRSGHPGMPMGAAAMGYVLWTRFLRHNPKDPAWFNRDRFVLSAGHGSMLLYALLFLTGYDLPLEEIKAFRQWGSRTPGHPEYGVTPGVETTTGPLGQGFANGVGMAMAEKYLSTRFNRDGFNIVDHYTYGIVSDGDLMEGISHESASLAAHLGLGKLIYLWDDNHVTIDGNTDLAFTEDVPARFTAYGWQVLSVADGNDTQAITEAFKEAQACTDRPSLLCIRTIIGYGSPAKADSAAAHGAPLGSVEVTRTKRALGWPEGATFVVPDNVLAAMDCSGRGMLAQQSWSELVAAYTEAYPKEAAELDNLRRGVLPAGWVDALSTFAPDSAMATRAASGKVLSAILEVIPGIFGGSADLTGSNKTRGVGQQGFQKNTALGSYVHFGVREHGMAAICNGIALHGALRPYCGTFLVFSDYMRPAVRLSAIMGLPVIYVFTHDSIGTGEDGPTHQGVEHLMSLRAIPNLVVLRPADANETMHAWRVALQRVEGPTALILTRQSVPSLTSQADGLVRGAYIVIREKGPACDLILIGTGSELQCVVHAASDLDAAGISTRVVSMPSWELFASQPKAYQEAVLPGEVTCRVVIEAGVSLGWDRYAGPHGRIIAMDRFGASAPGKVLFEKFGFTVDRVVSEAKAALSAVS